MRSVETPTTFAIAVQDEAVGGIGLHLAEDVDRISAELGYWLGEAYWGRGVATAAVRGVTAYVFREHTGLNRIFAVPFAWNHASARVLEKAGYTLEGRMRQSALKNGCITDQLLYSILRSEAPDAP
jgi:RimJ/RimL family protein N-acetyltransferase